MSLLYEALRKRDEGRKPPSSGGLPSPHGGSGGGGNGGGYGAGFDFAPAHPLRPYLIATAAIALILGLGAWAWHTVDDKMNAALALPPPVAAPPSAATAENPAPGAPLDVPSTTEAAAGKLLSQTDLDSLSALMPPTAAVAGLAAPPKLSPSAKLEREEARAEDAMAAGDYGLALQRYQELRRLYPDRADLTFGEGVALQKSGRGAEAIAAYEKTLDLDPGHIGARGNLLALLATSNPASSLQPLAQLARRYPGDALLLGQLALAQARAGLIREARATLEQATRLAPREAALQLNQAILADQAGDEKTAIAAYQAYLDLGDAEGLPAAQLRTARQRHDYLAARRHDPSTPAVAVDFAPPAEDDAMPAAATISGTR